MPWFYCSSCCDTIKKPKIAAHLRQCPSASFTCIDCSRTFDARNVHNHTNCVTEEQKYAQGATKPGGVAASGFFNADKSAPSPRQAAGHKFLSTKPPWRCTLCNTSCTSQESLLGHAAGAKHVRRARAALAASSTPTPAAAQASKDAVEEPSAAPDTTVLNTSSTATDGAAATPTAELHKKPSRKRKATNVAALHQSAANGEVANGEVVNDGDPKQRRRKANGSLVADDFPALDAVCSLLRRKGGSCGLSKLVSKATKKLGLHEADAAITVLQAIMDGDGQGLTVSVQLADHKD